MGSLREIIHANVTGYSEAMFNTARQHGAPDGAALESRRPAIDR